MTQLRVAFALALTFSVLGVMTANAQAVSKPPVPSIAIVDVEGVMRDSLAVKSARSQIDVIAKDTDRDNFMNADEAVNYGLIDSVLDKRILPSSEG